MRRLVAALVLAFASATAWAQQPVPQGAIVGTLTSQVGGAPVHLVDVRLYFIDSTRQVRDSLGIENLETFVDSSRSRIAASDSTGFFAIWRLAPGRYWMQGRRLGFTPIEAFIKIDSVTVFHDFTMEPVAALLDKVEIREASKTKLAQRLEGAGYLNRQRSNGVQATFVAAGEIQRNRASTVRDVLARYGIYDGGADIMMDRIGLRYDDVKDYPADLIAGVEIYRHGRPIEFSGTRSGPGILAKGGINVLLRPLVLIWTYIP